MPLFFYQMEIKPIAHIVCGFTSKFGIPRQSGLAPSTQALIVFEEEYAVAEAVRGLEGFSHLWLIWQFSEALREDWSPTVRPPRLGGNTRMGVFATRSPFRPNALGLSSVKLEKVTLDDRHQPVLHISGADLMDGTPIFDIKPYLTTTDCHPQARDGFVENHSDYTVEVRWPETSCPVLPETDRLALQEILSQDPRPAYHHDPRRSYAFEYGAYAIRFHVEGHILTVEEISCGESTSPNKP